MSPKIDSEYVNNFAKSFARGQPYSVRIGLLRLETKYTRYYKYSITC